MRTELPVCKRCFCLPLRYGLLTWGYIRLGLSNFLFITMCVSFYLMLKLFITEEKVSLNIARIVIAVCLLLLLITDIVLNVVFITGGHKKNVKMLRVYYIYSFILCILLFLMWIASVVSTLFEFSIGEIELTFHIYIILVDSTTMLALVLAQVCDLLLVRSEIIKLRNQCEFRFVNNAAEAQCTLKCEQLNAEEGLEHTYERSEEYK
ncbi:hypothetical protein PYW07_012080 [Mythimna separata]|uniref:Uncharacterized protein n=1 Tax=Mythimna separata TaxID=271217 RepID=A0AAD7YKI9_MYTSE|nr:hypothetical protein PYW07_012080 [Mythimna separata]